jgi:nitrite reductase/ring-hydroxylating ferredoxin subunit
LNLRPHEFLTPDRALILCRFHGAIFERLTGFCVAGPCAGRSLRAVPLKVIDGFVLLADGVDAVALCAEAP